MAKKQAPKKEPAQESSHSLSKEALLKHYGKSEKEGVHDDFAVECDGKQTTMGALRK